MKDKTSFWQNQYGSQLFQLLVQQCHLPGMVDIVICKAMQDKPENKISDHPLFYPEIRHPFFINVSASNTCGFLKRASSCSRLIKLESVFFALFLLRPFRYWFRKIYGSGKIKFSDSYAKAGR